MRWREVLVEGVGSGLILEYPTRRGEMGRNSQYFENDENLRRNLISSKNTEIKASWPASYAELGNKGS